jgi:hypothetical protein
MTMNKEEAAKKLKELEHNKLKIWPAQNTSKNQVAAINPEEYGFVSKCDLASYSMWLREVDVEDFDQSTYVEGTKPKKIKKAKGGAEDVTTN